MRIAYIVFYQGASLLKSRPFMRNLSLGCKIKVELIAELLRRSPHEVEIISQGEVDRHEFRFYPALEEGQRFHPSIPIYYASALPIRFINGFWSSNRTLQLFKARHAASPFDLVIIQTMKRPQLACAAYAKRLGLPVILQYEDDSFLDVAGQPSNGLIQRYHRHVCRGALKEMSGCMAVSPYLLSQFPDSIPKLLLRGVVSEAIINSDSKPRSARKNWAVFSGTHEGTQGEAQMIKAWNMLGLPDWELHIAGNGPLTPTLEKLAENNRSIVFHGFLKKEDNARLLCAAKIGLNPQDVTAAPGTSFAFKIIEYLAAGLHVITTPRGALESELEVGVTYIADNTPETIAACLKKMIGDGTYARTAEQATLQTYGPAAISQAMNRLIDQAIDQTTVRAN